MQRNHPARNWKDEAILIVPYDERWPYLFETEAQAIRKAINPWITGGIHHVGSTAVPGLAAKPIIDIAVGVADLKSSRPCIDVLIELGYHYAPYRPEVMHWFCKPDPSHRTHHLHLLPAGSPRFEDEIAFRDYLRAHPQDAAEYEAMKKQLAATLSDDREAYTEAKTGFIARVTAAAHAWRHSTQPTEVDPSTVPGE